MTDPTANCVLYNSGESVFIDTTDIGLIDTQRIEKNLSETSVGIIPVHYMDLPCDLEEISRIARENNLFVIEDACHALGAKYENNSIGNCKYSDVAFIAFIR